MSGLTMRAPRARYGFSSCALLALLLLAACSGGTSPTPTARSAPAATVNPASVQPADKVDDVFVQLLAIQQTQGPDAARQFATDQGLINAQDEVRVALTLDSDDPALVEATAIATGRLGARTVATYGNEIELVEPVPALLSYAQTRNRQSLFADLANFQHVRSVHRVAVPSVAGPLPTRADVASGTFAAGGVSEGVALTGADGWHAAGITGRGIRAGVIDLSFTGYTKVLAGANMTTRSFRSDGLVEDKEPDEDTVHGTACAEIVHEMAPDAELFLAAVDTTGGYINAIHWMESVGVTVMTSSVGFPGQAPLDGSSKLAQELDRAKDAGVFFAILAGNDASGTIDSKSGEGHYGAVFKDTDGDGWNDFAGAKTRNGFALRASANGTEIYLNWDDWTNPHVNYDLYLYDSTGKEVAHSTNDQSKGNKQPLEVIRARIPKGMYTLKVKKVNASDPDLPFNIVFRGAQLEQVTPAGSLWMPGDARGGFTVGAIGVKTDVVEDFSSQGPTQDGRKKPEIGAPDDASSFAYALAGFDTFPGTSAATPHMAGAAALYRQAFPDATPDAVFAYLAQHAKKPKGAKTGDNITGAGRLFLDAVPQDASTRPAPTRNANATPAASTPTVSATPRTTATASRPAPTPTQPAATPRAATAFTDDFSSAASGLPPQGYQNGEYHISADAGYFLSAWYQDRTARNAASETYEVQAHRVSGPNDALMGLQIRRLDKDNYLIFAIWNDGYASAYVKYQGSLQSLYAADQPNPAIAQGGVNTLRVTAQGAQFEFAANGQPLFRVTITNIWPEGQFGLVGGGGDKQAGEVAFDNYRFSTG